MYAERLDDDLDGVTAALSLASRPGLAWLDGDPAHADGRWSFVGSNPVAIRTSLLRWGLSPTQQRPSGLPRVPEWIGYVGYDGGVWLGRYEAVVGIDHGRGEAWVLGDDAAACARLVGRLGRGPRIVAGGVTTRVRASAREDHGRAIEAALEHIARGDIYQVNLARRWTAGWEGDPLALFLAMREASPVPLGFYVGAGDHAVLALTMETFLDWEGLGGRLATRPIKGTIARGADAIADARALRADPKEHAEHAMIVDLMRNDLGRVAATGSVKVERLMEVEPYAGLSHLVSTVACTTREGVTLDDVLAATFPPGSVTGAPKVRAMEIIDALEPHPRRVYCGAVGMIDRAGGARFAVAIRTAQVRAGTVTYHAGGGLVAASVVEREIAETELKARVFLDAVASLRTPPRSADITARAR